MDAIGLVRLDRLREPCQALAISAQERSAIAQQRNTFSDSPAPVLSVLFEPESVPSLSAVSGRASERATFSVSHSPAEAEGWAEVLVTGMTFDVAGLAGGPLVAPPTIRFRFDLGLDFASAGKSGANGDLVALTIAPGPHLGARGGAMIPVVRALCALAADLAGLDGAVAVCWHPAFSAMSPAHFIRMVHIWGEGGPFPALGLVAFQQSQDVRLRSIGLDHFIDQEFELSAELSADWPTAMRLAARIVHRLIESGPVDGEQQWVGAEDVDLMASPDAAGKLLNVSAKR